MEYGPIRAAELYALANDLADLAAVPIEPSLRVTEISQNLETGAIIIENEDDPDVEPMTPLAILMATSELRIPAHAPAHLASEAEREVMADNAHILAYLGAMVTHEIDVDVKSGENPGELQAAQQGLQELSAKLRSSYAGSTTEPDPRVHDTLRRVDDRVNGRSVNRPLSGGLVV